MGRADDLNGFRAFADATRWQFAKTYVESYPHEYTLRRWCDPKAFREAIACIERWGVLEPFWRSQARYLYLDERKYWHMGNAASGDSARQPGLINRTWVDVARHRADALALGYDGERLESLVARWNALLARARAAPAGDAGEHETAWRP